MSNDEIIKDEQLKILSGAITRLESQLEHSGETVFQMLQTIKYLKAENESLRKQIETAKNGY